MHVSVCARIYVCGRVYIYICVCGGREGREMHTQQLGDRSCAVNPRLPSKLTVRWISER